LESPITAIRQTSGIQSDDETASNIWVQNVNRTNVKNAKIEPVLIHKHSIGIIIEIIIEISSEKNSEMSFISTTFQKMIALCKNVIITKKNFKENFFCLNNKILLFNLLYSRDFVSN